MPWATTNTPTQKGEGKKEGNFHELPRFHRRVKHTAGEANENTGTASG